MAYPIHSPQDVVNKLNNSICTYDGFPVYVQTADGTNLRLSSLIKSKKVPKDCLVTDDKFNYSAFPLGYYWDDNLKLGTYLMRFPRRGTSQGLVKQAISGCSMLSASFFTSPSMGKCILGQHVGLEEAVELAKSDSFSEGNIFPFHRYLALTTVEGSVFVACRNKTIGILESNNKIYILQKQLRPAIEVELAQSGYSRLI